MTTKLQQEKADRAIGALRKYPDGVDSVRDLLTDLMHLCDRDGVSFDAELAVARRNFEAEKA